jgi:WD40 repeat protein
MKNILLISVLFFTIISAKEITPYKYVQASEAVTDFVKVDDLLIIGTEEGIIDIYDLKKDELIDQIKLPKVKNIFGNDIRSLITSVDYHQGKIIFIKRLLSGYHELYLYDENKKLTKLIDASQYFSLKKVKFVNDKIAIIAFMSNELMLYDLENRKIVYKKLYNLASLSDMIFDEKKEYVFTADETPQISKIDILTGKIVQKFFKANKRDIFSIDYKNGKLISGGKDRRVILYQTPEKYTMTKGDFFIYDVALNPDASKAAFVKNEENDISVIDTASMEEIMLLKGHAQTILKIDFYTSNELISADEDDRLMFWRLE